MTIDQFNIMKELVTEYWSQFTLLVGIIFGGTGYIVKTILAYRFKVKEITFTNLHSLRNKEAKELYLSILDVEECLNTLCEEMADVLNADDDTEDILEEILDDEFYDKLNASYDKFIDHSVSLDLIISEQQSDELDKYLSKLTNCREMVLKATQNILNDDKTKISFEHLKQVHHFLNNDFEVDLESITRLIRTINGVK